jgi:putative aminopeptidase FrvX
MAKTPKLLDELLRTGAPSGYEGPASAIWRDAASFASLSSDGLGSSVARIGEEGLLLAVVGHIDEIGLVVTHIDEKGFLYFSPIGGWDPQILVGQRIEVRGRNGLVPGVVGRKPIHLLDADQRKKVVELKGLHIDIGAADRDEAGELIGIGDPAVIAAEPVELAGERLASRSMDNRLGAYVALEALRRVEESGALSGTSFAAIAAVQEEVGLFGARTSAFEVQPDLAIAVDVTHGTDAPGVDEKEVGSHPLGSGPVIGRGSTLSPKVFELLVETAGEAGIEYTVAASGRGTSTDADAIQISRSGIPTGLVSIPLRYMHSPVEVVDLGDVEATVELIAAFAGRLSADVDLSR